MDSADSRKENDVTILNGDFFKGHSEKRKKNAKTRVFNSGLYTTGPHRQRF